jgi:archaeal flagellar protein FlaF
MESILPSLIALAVLLMGAATTYASTHRTVDQVATTWKAMMVQAEERAGTRLDLREVTVDETGTEIEVRLLNAGNTKIDAFDRMDVILEYTDVGNQKRVAWFSYRTSNPGTGEWTVSVIAPDTFDPRILNPGEELTMLLIVNPPVGTGPIHRVTIATPNGVPLSTTFAR